ncbi:hypothetical protein [Billgrantia endophytica]|uniref:Uncharacterized protein n=1 Tax=Billgrantia endophytica TaxID=2033802 RepID=A0A2N7TWM9_9GAMM|nr:hypothetical protein [Halomonas endophytica]PMR72593.1 hypothetical protein C1H69_20320 [Halomonas endophytica]
MTCLGKPPPNAMMTLRFATIWDHPLPRIQAKARATEPLTTERFLTIWDDPAPAVESTKRKRSARRLPAFYI